MKPGRDGFARGFDVGNLREQFEVQNGTLLIVQQRTFLRSGNKNNGSTDVTLTKAGLVVIDFF